MYRLSLDRTRDDRGVTLTEVLVAIVILGIVMVPLANAFVAFASNTKAVEYRLSASHDAQIATAYFAQDVQSLGVRDWDGSYPWELEQSVWLNVANRDAPACGTGTTQSVIRMAWDDPTSVSGDPRVTRVNYQIRVTGGERQLIRILCTDDGDGDFADDSPFTIVIVHNLADTSPVTVQCWDERSSPQSCTATSEGDIPQTITMTLRIKHPSYSETFEVKLTGQRRQS